MKHEFLLFNDFIPLRDFQCVWDCFRFGVDSQCIIVGQYTWMVSSDSNPEDFIAGLKSNGTVRRIAADLDPSLVDSFIKAGFYAQPKVPIKLKFEGLSSKINARGLGIPGWRSKPR